ncbi:hypothetical protein DSO57_1034795 [Entomophthora muscae]|uniref:Uncharacterized protein n=1 Tax=Entomophthora muscae TaxID=34485 RepID=A0ACC2REK3_9FUNG|nr:hypothetical protein DSO57_1034795 [Entomophthora muscae]
MNHLIFSAVLTACLGIGGHQYNYQHGPFNKPPGKYYYKELAQLNSFEQYSWPTLVLPHSTQSVAIYICIYYVLTYFSGNFGRYKVHAKVFCLMMTVYPIVTALTGFQVANLVPYFARILPKLLGLYTSQSTNPASPTPHQATRLLTLTPKPPPIPPLSLMPSLSQAQMKAMFILPIPSPSCPLKSKINLFFVTTY